MDTDSVVAGAQVLPNYLTQVTSSWQSEWPCRHQPAITQGRTTGGGAVWKLPWCALASHVQRPRVLCHMCHCKCLSSQQFLHDLQVTCSHPSSGSTSKKRRACLCRPVKPSNRRPDSPQDPSGCSDQTPLAGTPAPPNMHIR